MDQKTQNLLISQSDFTIPLDHFGVIVWPLERSDCSDSQKRTEARRTSTRLQVETDRILSKNWNKTSLRVCSSAVANLMRFDESEFINLVRL